MELLVEVKATGVCGTDLHILEDTFHNFPPVVLGHEGAGEVDPELLACTENTILQPHASCCAARWHMTQEIISDLGRFLHGEPLKLQVSLRQYRLMTQE